MKACPRRARRKTEIETETKTETETETETEKGCDSLPEATKKALESDGKCDAVRGERAIDDTERRGEARVVLGCRASWSPEGGMPATAQLA